MMEITINLSEYGMECQVPLVCFNRSVEIFQKINNTDAITIQELQMRMLFGLATEISNEVKADIAFMERERRIILFVIPFLVFGAIALRTVFRLYSKLILLIIFIIKKFCYLWCARFKCCKKLENYINQGKKILFFMTILLFFFYLVTLYRLI